MVHQRQHRHRGHRKQHGGHHGHRGHGHKGGTSQKSGGTSTLGVSPTNSQKLIYIAKKLGLDALAEMQGSTVNLFDVQLLTASANPQILSFFNAPQGKSQNFTNFSAAALKAGEALLIERLSFFLIKLSSANLALDSSAILDIVPIGSLADATFTDQEGSSGIQFPGSLKTGTGQISIANQVVVKSFNVFEQNPEFNPLTTGTAVSLVSAAAVPANTTGVRGQNVIPLEAPPVLPPNQGLQVDYRIGPIGTITLPAGIASYAIMAVAGRFGCIFASKTTL